MKISIKSVKRSTMISRIMSYKVLSICFVFFTSATSVAQTCNERIIPATPDDRFEVSGGEVKDLRTGLIWQRCIFGHSWNGTTCSDNGTGIDYHYWSFALGLADGDWRVPNIKELASIVETACASPAINSTIFPNTSSGRYWSSSPYVQSSNYVWIVDFGSGSLTNTNAKSSSQYSRSYIRLVRGGQ